ncbi:MAG: insulinase family protein [Deltaproteobacteria bacterium]|nr:insulinase family protein [Deltaproteobacteria bacterium]
MYRKTVLENGLRIVTESLGHFQSLSLGIWVNVGSREEREEENGISHFIEHMIFKGTRTRNPLQIAKQLDAIGGLSNAFTGKENTCFHARVLSKHFYELADILSDIFLNSIFDPKEMDRERQVILQEINMVEDMPDEHIHVLFNRLLWVEHPLGMSILGTSDTVSRIDKEDILGYIGRFYRPERIIIAAAGDVEHEKVVDFFSPLFGGLEPSDDVTRRAPPRINGGVSCHQKELEQVHLCLGGKGPHLSSDFRYAGALLNTILGGNMSSRLFQEIREKRGLAYSVYSFITSYIDTGMFGIYVATDPLAVNKVLGIINREVGKILRGMISKEDLEAAKEHLVGSIILGAESTDSRMMRLAKNEYVFGKHITYEELVQKIEKVTIDEVVAVSHETFQDNGVSLVTLGPVDGDDLELACLHFK